ncbi:MAG: hypothetical protein LBB07_02395 [Bifidobacteriaceae bacterium]|jgi:putative peptidoglycan lipid II flippase|nr:hypothetical protein [Bifidobacteriaceae bacterium]
MSRNNEPPVDTVVLDINEIKKKVEKKSNIAKQSSVLALGTLFSRITGQLRSIALVAALGATGMAANSFDIANNIPNTMLVIISGGILNSILVPQIIKAYKYKNSQERLNKLLTLFGITILIITILLTLAAPIIVRLYAGIHWTVPQINLAIAFSYLCMPQVFFYGLYTILGQVSSANERFGIYGWAPVANNIISIAGFTTFIIYIRHINAIDSVNNLSSWNVTMIALLCLTATLGIAVQSLLMFIPLKKANFKFRPSFGLRGIGLREITNVSLWTFLIVLLEEIVALVFIKIASDAPIAAAGSDIASGLAIAGNASYTQAVIIYIVPYSLVAVSVATTMFTRLSKDAAKKNMLSVGRQVTSGIKTVSVFMVFSFLLVLLEGNHIVRVLIPSATHFSFETISSLLIPFSFILIPISNILLMKRVFFALTDAKKAFLYSLPYAILALTLALLFSFFAPPRIWTILVVVSAAIAYWVDCFFFTWGIKKELRSAFSIQSLIGFYIKEIMAAIPTLFIGLLAKYLLGWTYFLGWFEALFQLAIIGGCMGTAYLFMLRILKVEQLSFYTKPIISAVEKLKYRLFKKEK